MGVSSARLDSVPAQKVTQDSLWLRSRRWDLIFITLSVIVVPLPYLVYLALRSSIFASSLSTSLNIPIEEVDNWARNAVNAFVAIAIGGPHMMSTFLRTGLDKSFNQRYPMLIRSSIIIPIVVISLAYLNLTLLLTVFFFWAATHVLHQVTFIVELYNRKEHKYARPGTALSLWSRGIDYAVILTCLFPIAALKISQGEFNIGVNDLTRVIPTVFQQTWFFVVMSGIFAVALFAYIVKTVNEYRSGYINWPKTIFILCTIAVAFTMPALPNLDTAFQGLNTWHSFQYLALTFYIIKVKQEYGQLDKEAPLIARISKSSKDARALYAFSASLLVGSAVVFTIVYLLTYVVRPDLVAQPNLHFDIAYYTAILSFLWIHYYHDHFLFTDFEVLDKAYEKGSNA